MLKDYLTLQCIWADLDLFGSEMTTEIWQPWECKQKMSKRFFFTNKQLTLNIYLDVFFCGIQIHVNLFYCSIRFTLPDTTILFIQASLTIPNQLA